MQLGHKIMIFPTKEQEILFKKSCGVARWTYNHCVLWNRKAYELNKLGFPCNKSVSGGRIRKHITKLKKRKKYIWLNEVGSNVIKEAVRNYDKAVTRSIDGISGKPKLKKKHNSSMSFYVNYESFKKTKKGFQGEKIGEVITANPLPELPENQKHYSNPTISFDGKHWYVSVSIKVEVQKTDLVKTKLGIDRGIKSMCYCSDDTSFKNVNKSKKMKHLKKILKKEQRKLSRMFRQNTKRYVEATGTDGKKHLKPIWKRPLRECKNIQKQNQKIKLINKRITDYRNNYIHQMTRTIINKKPKTIIIEDLNIQGMMKNKHLSKAIGECCLYEIGRQIEYKGKLLGIKIIKADRFYPSSKRCSCCGHIKKDLKLSDRIYKCSECGLIIDRDLNASINLANYK